MQSVLVIMIIVFLAVPIGLVFLVLYNFTKFYLLCLSFQVNYNLSLCYSAEYYTVTRRHCYSACYIVQMG